VSELLDAETGAWSVHARGLSPGWTGRSDRRAVRSFRGRAVFVEVLQPIEDTGVSRVAAAAGPETIEVEVDGRRWVLPIPEYARRTCAGCLIPAVREDAR